MDRRPSRYARKNPGKTPDSASPGGSPPPAGPRQEVRVEITGLAPGGDAVGRQLGGAADGRVTFVPFAAPGELVRVALVRERARVAWADLLDVERASAARVEPPCPLFRRCGGCQWQHVDDRLQRSAKGEIVGRALGLTVAEASAVGPSYGYRERARLAVAVASPAHPVVGFRARRSHEIVDVPTCPLLAPSLDEALPEARRRATGVPPGSEISLLLGRGPTGDFVLGEAGGRGFRVEDERVEEADLQNAAGWPNVAEPGGRPLLLPPGGFAQVSRAANSALCEAIVEALGPRPGKVLELFAGSGNFTRLLVERATAVIASDADSQAVERGRRNVPEADWRPATGLGPTVLPVDTILADPPREGLDDRSLALCAAAQRLVYVSCDPQTLQRDMGHLLRRGMRLAGAKAFDLMPQTHHIEVVALFIRR
jgi:23S rRNA (uracil1939-C5)-methyltransferase